MVIVQLARDFLQGPSEVDAGHPSAWLIMNWKETVPDRYGRILAFMQFTASQAVFDIM
jgi:hypothetical protein